MKAKIKRIQISPDAFLRIMQTGTSWKVVKGVPVNAKVRGMTLDPYTQTFNLFVEHDSFDAVDVHVSFPLLATEFLKI